MKIIIKKYDWFLTILAVVLFFTLPVAAQVNIGNENPPNLFSILEINNAQPKDGGLRLPQLTTSERNTNLTPKLASNPNRAKGLVIYNVTIGCLEFWNGTTWISLCASVLPVFEVDPQNLLFQSGETTGKTVSVTTDISGWTTEITYNQGTGWLTISSVTGTSFVVAPNSNNATTASRTATITVRAGGLTKTVTVTQLGTVQTRLTNSYVGAFWRHDQTGERIIRVNYTDSWTASVIWYDGNWGSGDGIVLSTDPSADPNLGWLSGADESQVANMLDPAKDAAYSVSGSATTVSGTGNIFFRIGLKSQFTAFDPESKPARYAVVTISYGDPAKYWKVYIRQGEGDDYAPNNSSGARWSPYNLGTTNNFVDYPTKAGYFYQWCYDNIDITPRPYAANPDASLIPPYSGNVTGLYSLAGVCPTTNAYRIPTGDREISTDDLIVLSTSTSLNLSVAGGYYADGFFDRRALNPTAYSPNGTANSAVSWTNDQVAYNGMLIYDVSSNASIFFPAAGSRDYINGSLDRSGAWGWYWSSTPADFWQSANDMSFNTNGAPGVLGHFKTYGNNIRCVR